MKNFGFHYASMYDSMYQDKDYSQECDQIEWAFERFGAAAIESVLDIGCGTGGHSLELANRGYEIVGVDQSPSMLEEAKSKSSSQDSSPNPLFLYGQAEDLDVGREFDSVLMMFAVLSYLSTNELLINGLRSVSRHLKPGGLFLADFWYGPGVLTDPPTVRSHERQLDGMTIRRHVTPSLCMVNNTCRLEYRLTTADTQGVLESHSEEHVMRYFFGPELELSLATAGLDLVRLGQNPEWQVDLDGAPWTASLIARRRADE